MDGYYSPEEKKTGRFWWLAFSVINTFSFQFLAGNVIILFIIRLGASKTMVGIVSSFFYISYFIMPLGRILSLRLGMARAFTLAWMVRYIAISPILITPFIAMSDKPGSLDTALWIVVCGYLGFQMFRGAGLVSYSPLLTEISMGEDRGSYLSLSRILTDIAILLGSLIVAFFIGEQAPLGRYMISFAIGIGLGYLGVFTLSRLPEIKRPEGHRDQGLMYSLKSVFRDRKFRRYFLTLFTVGFVGGILRPFILVYAKDVYALSDKNVLLLTVAGSLGAISMGFISRKFLDRLGAKPMLMIWIILMILSSATIIFVPYIGSWFSWIFLIVIFYASTMGLNGSDNTTQLYFFSMIEPEQQLNFGILQFLATGISGTAGATLAGVFLDYLQNPAGVDPLQSHVYLFSILTILLALALFFAAGMERLGAKSLRQSLSELFRLRERTRGMG
ncbi:MFS transporter [Spirochaeta isovalerica]|uniref:MFS family permease n=1 Tax=Spirochaeta isovalerica TaxID=150 RepID=A0A841RF93_9SPIO|nr:MFS transporter [Spirochaeta isovalerica]MBB6481489.1 MFS family permease [Spirochaeta isovalerica]